MTRTMIAAVAILTAVALTGPGVAHGEWIFAAPPTVGPGTDFFYAVDGTAGSDTWAVGFREPAEGDHRSLIGHFDGVSWTQFPAPDTGVPDPFESLTGVVAISPDHAVAVGSYTPVGAVAQPLAMEWDGESWQLVSTPEFSGGGSFWALDRTPSGEIWASGFRYGVAFLARKNGSSWSIEDAPQVGSWRNRFYALHAFSDDEIWVVGTHGEDQGDFNILLQRYDGSGSWTSFNIPTPGWLDSMTGVYAAASDDVWAVGYYYHTTLFLTQPLIMHFDGSTWSQFQLPPFPEGSAEFRGMTGTGPDDIYAAGTYATADGTPRPFMMHYDGTGWSVMALPPTDGSGEWFRGMGTAPDGVVWAVGQYFNGTSTEPMTFYLDGQQPASAGEGDLASSLRVAGAVPNPFRGETEIRFALDRPGPIRLRIWNVSGKQVRMLFLDAMSPGDHAFRWDGTDSSGEVVPAGVYFYDLAVAGGVMRQKVVRIW